MIKYDNKEYRNLQEQVQKNKDDIEELSTKQSGSVVTWNQELDTGEEIAEIEIDGIPTAVYAPKSGSKVSWTQRLIEGEKIAQITIDGVTTDVYSRSYSSQLNDLSSQIALKQDHLYSGVNIKTINGTTLMGSGNIQISGEDTSVGTVELTSTQFNSLATNGYTALTSDQLDIMREYQIVKLVYSGLPTPIAVFMIFSIIDYVSLKSGTYRWFYTAITMNWLADNDFPSINRILFTSDSTSTMLRLEEIPVMTVGSTYLDDQEFQEDAGDIYAPTFYTHNINMTYTSSSATFEIRFSFVDHTSDEYTTLSSLVSKFDSAFVIGCTGYVNNGTYGQAYSVTPSKVYGIVNGAQTTISYTTTGLTVTDTVKQLG